MVDGFEILKIEKHKKNIRFYTILGLLNLLISILLIDIIIKYDNCEDNKYKMLYALVCAFVPSSILTFILDVLEIKDYKKILIKK